MRQTVVLVLRGRDAFSAKLVESGFEVINLELLKIEPVEDINLSPERFGEFDGLFFTSPYAAEAFLAAFESSGSGYEGKIYVLGERTRNVLEKAGIGVRYQSGANTAAEMIEMFGDSEFAGKRFLFVRGDKSLRTIPDLLAGKADVSELVVYRTVEISPDHTAAANVRERIAIGEIDWMCFFSPSGVESFFRQVYSKNLKGIKTAVIGQTTGGKAQESGLNVDFISRRTRAEDFAADLVEHIKNIA